MPSSHVKVNEFEQQGDDPSTRVSEPDYMDMEGHQVREELEELDRELAILREGPFGPNSEFMRSFPPDERETLLKALEEEGVMPPQTEDLISDEELEELARDEEGTRRPTKAKNSLKVTLSIPTTHKIYVKRFNKALQEAEKPNADEKSYFALWKWYLRCQQHVSNFAIIISEEIWHFLWTTQSTKYYRPRHLQMLAKDMTSAGVQLEDKELVQYIDALQAVGEFSTAAEAWEEHKTRLGNITDLAATFWMTGVRIYADLGKPQKAQSIAFECYDYTTLVDPEVLVLVIAAWARSQSGFAPTKTWWCYLELRRILERNEDDQKILNILGRISGTLLEAGRTELALAVFKDMYLFRHKKADDSWSFFKDMVETLQDTQLLGEDLINKVGLASFVFLPRSYQNKFFFGSWLKWLIGADRVDEAAIVVELMYERGVRPDAGHLNGLIAGYLREGSPSARQTAESTAWSMIQARIDMVRKRDTQGDEQASTAREEPLLVQRKAPSFLRRGAPPATIETFSILLQYYTRRSELAKAGELTDVMIGSADIKPNSFIMNHWLYASLRSGDAHEVWTKYLALTETIEPDLETFAALWDTAKASYAAAATGDKGFPSARKVFAEMQGWFASASSQKRNAAQNDFSHELYEQIIRCFCLTSDVKGILCAMYGLRESFGALPHEEAMRLILISVARSFGADFASHLHPRDRGLRALRKSQYQGALHTLTNIFVTILDRKLVDADMDPEELGDAESPQAQGLRLDALSTFLCMVIDRRMEMGASLLEDVSQVADEMEASVPEEVLNRHDWPGNF
ncbi:hypothetical protein RBB50_004063 [Rhinocladiella similis]